MVKYKLTYFNLRGRAEIPRLIFAVAGQEFEDVRINGKTDWPSLKSSKFYVGIKIYDKHKQYKNMRGQVTSL